MLYMQAFSLFCIQMQAAKAEQTKNRLFCVHTVNSGRSWYPVDLSPYKAEQCCFVQIKYTGSAAINIHTPTRR